MSLEYRKKWSHARGEYFRDLQTVEFSPSGNYLAVGGGAGRAVLAEENGQPVAVVQHSSTSVVATKWFYPDVLVCAFKDGVIVDVSIVRVFISS